MIVEVALLDEVLLHSLAEGHEHLATLEIGTVEHGIDRGRDTVGVGLMLTFIEEVVDGVAVGEHNGIVSPFVAQDVDKQTVAGAAGLTLETLIGAHYLTYISLFHQGLECREIGLPEIAVGGLDIHRVAQRLGTAVYGIVLGTGMGLEITAIVALHAEDGLHTQYCIHIGILATGLLTATPTGIAEDVHIGTPEGEFGVAGVVDDTLGYVEDVVVGTVPVGTGLVAHGRKHVVD